MRDLRQKSIDAIIWNLIEKYGIQLVSLVIGIVLARLLTPSDYGLIGMITVFFAIAMVFVNSGFGMAFIQNKEATEKDGGTIFIFNIVVSLVLYLVLWFLAPYIALFYDQAQLIKLVRIASLVIVINSFSMMHIANLKKQVDFKKKSIITFISTLFSGFIGISAALLDFGVWSLVFQKLSNALITTISLWVFYKWRPLIIFEIRSLKKLFSFSLWILLSSLMTTIFNNIYVLVIGKYFPLSQLGFYSKAKGYQTLLSQQPSSAIGVVSFPVFSKLQGNPVALKSSLKKFTQHLMFFLAPLIGIAIVVAKPMILIVLTEKWVPMTQYLQVLLVAAILYPMHLLNVQLLNAIGKTKLNFFLSLIKNLLRVLNIIIMYQYGIIFIIIGEVIVSFLSLFVNGFYSKNLINYGMFEQLGDVLRTIVSMILSILLGFILLNLLSNDILKICVGIVTMSLTYLLFQFAINKNIFYANLEIVRDKLFIKNGK